MPVSRRRRRRTQNTPRGAGAPRPAARTPARKRKNYLYLIASAVIAVLVIAGFALGGANFGHGGAGTRAGSSDSYVEGVGVQQVLMPDAFHVPEGDTVEYNTIPPTSGPHWGVTSTTPARCGFYEEGQPDERIVHNLEHSNIVISYNLSDPAKVEELKDAVDSIGLASVWGVTRFYDHEEFPEGTIALAAWGVLDTMQEVDRDRIREFVDTYAGNLGPERVVC